MIRQACRAVVIGPERTDYHDLGQPNEEHWGDHAVELVWRWHYRCWFPWHFHLALRFDYAIVDTPLTGRRGKEFTPAVIRRGDTLSFHHTITFDVTA